MKTVMLTVLGNSLLSLYGLNLLGDFIQITDLLYTN